MTVYNKPVSDYSGLLQTYSLLQKFSNNSFMILRNNLK